MKLFVAIVLATAFSVTTAQLKWRLLDNGNNGPGPRQGGAMAYDYSENRLVVFGGISNESTLANDVWIYDVVGGSWSQAHLGGNDTTEVPVGRLYFNFGIVTVDGTVMLVVTHGIGSGGAEYDDVWAFRLDTNEWREITIENPDTGPGARYGGHFGALYGETDTLWIGAGFTLTTTLATRYIDTYKLRFTSRVSARWEEVFGQPSRGNQFDPLQPHGRCLQGSAVVEAEKLVMWGGCMRGGTGGGPCPTEDSWYFDDNEGKWTELPRCATARRWAAMAPLTNSPGKAVLYGGTDSDTGQVISAVPYPEEEVLVVDVNEETWTRYLTNPDDSTGTYPSRRFTHVMAAGSSDAVYLYGGQTLSDSTIMGDLWVLSGALNETDTTGCDRVWFSYAHLHGLFQAIGFGILFPLGALIARYYRCKNKAWFILHVSVQMTAVVFAIIGFVLIFFGGASPEPTHPHALIGIILMALMLVQPINGIFRPHIKKDKEKSIYRKVWEWFHRLYGATVITVGLLQVTLGVFLIVPPQGVWIVWIIMLAVWVITYIVHEIVKWVRIAKCGGDDRDRDTEMKTF